MNTVVDEPAVEVERPRGATGPRRRARVPWLLALVLPAVGFVLYGSSGRDDAYITYWEADQLLRTGRLGNYNGARLEQSSSLLHTLVLAAVTLVSRVPVPTAGPWVSIAARALCAPAAFWLCGMLEPRGRVVAAVLVATLPPLVYWSFGGLETSLATLLVLVACACLIQAVEGKTTRVLPACGALIGVIAVRPEMGIVFAFALVLAAIVLRGVRRDGSRTAAGVRLLAWAGVAAGLLLALSAFRRVYFGEWFPHPVAMKTGSSDLPLGARYIGTTLLQSGGLIAVVVGIAFVVQVVRRRSVAPGWVIASALVVVGALVVLVPGGDWMECGRLLAPWLALMVVLVGASVTKLALKPRQTLTILLVVANAFGLVNYAARFSTGTAAWSSVVWKSRFVRNLGTPNQLSANWWERRNAVHQRDAEFIRIAEPVLDAAARVVAPRRLRYASVQGGMVVYYLQQHAIDRGHPFRFVDVDGLTDDGLDSCRGNSRAGLTGKPVPISHVVASGCAPAPDVVSGLRNPGPPLTDEYVPFSVQLGVLKASRWPSGGGVDAGQWIGVRSDLVPKVERILLSDQGAVSRISSRRLRPDRPLTPRPRTCHVSGTTTRCGTMRA
jgi:hypothetical protein